MHAMFSMSKTPLLTTFRSSLVTQQVKEPSIITAVAQVAAVVQVRSLTWELPHTMSEAKKKKKKKKRTFMGFFSVWLEILPGGISSRLFSLGFLFFTLQFPSSLNTGYAFFFVLTAHCWGTDDEFSCSLTKYWSDGFVTLQTAINAAIIQVREGLKINMNKCRGIKVLIKDGVPSGFHTFIS